MMDEETKGQDVEVEVTDQAAETAEAEKGPSEVEMAFDAMLDESARLLELLGRAITTTAQDITSLMVLHVDRDTRERLDLLVDAEIAKSRRAAAAKMLDEGMESNAEVFEKVERTRAQIEALKQQMRNLVVVES
jgi:hypothetical protein